MSLLKILPLFQKITSCLLSFHSKLAFDWCSTFGTLGRCFFGPKITLEGIEAFFLTTRRGPPMYRPPLFPLLAPEGGSRTCRAATFWRNLPAVAKKEEEASPSISDWVPFSSPPLFACTYTPQAHRHQHTTSQHHADSCEAGQSSRADSHGSWRKLSPVQRAIPKQLQPSNFGPAVSMALVGCMRL